MEERCIWYVGVKFYVSRVPWAWSPPSKSPMLIYLGPVWPTSQASVVNPPESCSVLILSTAFLVQMIDIVNHRYFSNIFKWCAKQNVTYNNNCSWNCYFSLMSFITFQVQTVQGGFGIVPDFSILTKDWTKSVVEHVLSMHEALGSIPGTSS